MQTYKLRKKELKDNYRLFMRQLAKEARGVDPKEAASMYEEN